MNANETRGEAGAVSCPRKRQYILCPEGRKALKESGDTAALEHAMNCENCDQILVSCPWNYQPVPWQGMSLTDPPPARQLLRETQYVRESLPLDRIERYGRFYSGQEQWDAQVEEFRRKEGRPSLTVNLLPGLVARMIAKSAAEGDPLSKEEQVELVLAVTMLNQDAQRLYNYLLSSVAECCATCTAATIEVRP